MLIALQTLLFSWKLFIYILDSLMAQSNKTAHWLEISVSDFLSLTKTSDKRIPVTCVNALHLHVSWQPQSLCADKSTFCFFTIHIFLQKRTAEVQLLMPYTTPFSFIRHEHANKLWYPKYNTSISFVKR